MYTRVTNVLFALQHQELLRSPAAPVEASKKELARAQAVFSLLHAYFLSVCAAAEIEPNVRLPFFAVVQ